MRCTLILALLAGAVSHVTAQTWVARYNGPANDEDQARAIAVDNEGCVYVAGSSWGSGTDRDWATLRYGAAGESLWVVRFDGEAHGPDEVFAVDAAGGSVVVAGGVSAASFYTDMKIIAYDVNGGVQWTQSYNGPAAGNDMALAACLDDAGNAFVTGYASYPDSGWDLTTIKYDASGTEEWVARYSTADEDYGVAVAADGAGNVYVVGNSGSPYTSSWDFVTIKYNSDGQEQWVARYNGPGDGADEAHGLALDPDGSVIVTGGSEGMGTSYDFSTIKYNAAGETLWVRRLDGPSSGPDAANAIARAQDGGVAVTGYSQDPASEFDYLTVMYGPDGGRQWSARYDGSGHSYDEARGIVLDTDGSVYVVGTSTGATSRTDYALVKYNAQGGECWVHRYDGPAGNLDEAHGLVLSALDGVTVTGASTGSGTGLDYATVRYPRTGIAESEPARSGRCRLLPGPGVFYGPAHVGYELAERSRVHLTVLDAAGRVVSFGDSGIQEPGSRRMTVSVDADRSGGVYFARLRVEPLGDLPAGAELVAKLLLLR
jgi:uncharacterized delta-60 repeat protein